ncbi:MAG: DNA polymerase III subunit delta [Verrucomicrobiae bacterium]|nr:DNA polymerase III subunit delta [Verrucomicrobiae bacterium]
MSAKAKESVKEGVAPVYLIFGNDEYMASEAARKTVETYCPPDQQAFGLEIVEAAVDTVEEAITAIQKCVGGLRTMGFLMGGRKVVWMRDATFLSDSTKPGKSADVKAELAKLTADIKAGWGDAQLLVVSSPKVDKRSAFYKACNSVGKVIEHDLPERGGQAEKTVRERARKLLADEGLTMDAPAFNAFIDRTGIDTRMIMQEITKLSLYLGGKGKVTQDVVELIVAPSRDAMAWSFSEAIARRDMPGALNILRRLVFQRESPFAMLIAVEKMFSQFLILRSAMDRGWLKLEVNGNWKQAAWIDSSEMEQTLAALGGDNPRTLHPYRLAILASQATGFSRDELVYYQERVIRTHERMLSVGSMPQDLLLQMLVIEITGRYRQAG